MKDAVKNRLNNLVESGYDVKLGDYFREAFRLMNANIGIFMGFFLLTIFVEMFLSGLGRWSILSIFVSLPISMGWYLVALKVQNTQPFEFANFFDGFKHFQPLALLIMIRFVLFVIALLPFLGYGYFALGSVIYETSLLELDPVEDQEAIQEAVEVIVAEINWSIFLLSLLPFLFLRIVWLFAPMLVVFYNYEAWDALEMSRKIITKRFGEFFLFSILLMSLIIAGVLMFFIGWIYTVPVTILAIYVAFSQITELKIETPASDENDLLDHFVN